MFHVSNLLLLVSASCLLSSPEILLPMFQYSLPAVSYEMHHGNHGNVAPEQEIATPNPLKANSSLAANVC